MSVPSPYAELLTRVPVREAVVDVLGTPTRYWEYGDPDAATTLILVHGFRGDHHGLEPVIAHLRGVRILAPDLPGFGTSARFADREHSVAAYAAWLTAFTAALDLGEDTVIVGHSFGSIVVSAAVAQGLPCARVVLINPIAAPALEGPRGILTRLAVLYYRLGALLPERVGFGLLRNRAIVRVMSEAMAKTTDAGLRRWIHDQHHRYFSAFADRDVVLEAFTASVSHDVSEFAADITQPVLLIASDKDDITPIAAQHALCARFPDARLRVIGGVGHLIHYEAPAEAARHIMGELGESQ
ncbi:Lysophospholipase, alpha-beta hydrolase superfamily [Paramicrobacterium humi]|uniref:Lysophospholipase, alpha-beta hydrolase superfamily n=1 Tax=Paramicrobacterium humi TaxID=640635 RepID=A0A1H4R312_9MICO|nr:alpha/beta hydrolase [Microbacterium humi]SEC26255.1 Lysophospholipase, alpha-beta hydrolase superfamily [Microbacterium humi]